MIRPIGLFEWKTEYFCPSVNFIWVEKAFNASYPSNSQFQRDLVVSYWKLGEVHTTVKDTNLAITHYQKALEKLLWMQEKSILAKDDEQYILQLREKLSLN